MDTVRCSGSNLIKFAKVWGFLGWSVQAQVEKVLANKYADVNRQAILFAYKEIGPLNNDIAEALMDWIRQDDIEIRECSEMEDLMARGMEGDLLY